MKFIGSKLIRTGEFYGQGIEQSNDDFRTDLYGDVDLVTSPIFDDESFYSDDGFDFLGEIEEVGNRPWEIAPLDKKFRVIFLLVMIIIGPDIKNINVRHAT